MNEDQTTTAMPVEETPATGLETRVDETEPAPTQEEPATPARSVPEESTVAPEQTAQKMAEPSTAPLPPQRPVAASDAPPNLDAILDIPVDVSIVLGSLQMPVSKLMTLGVGQVVALDRGTEEPVDVTVNGRLVARGNIILMEGEQKRVGVSLTELVGSCGGARA